MRTSSVKMWSMAKWLQIFLRNKFFDQIFLLNTCRYNAHIFLIFSDWKTNYLHLKSSNSMWWSSSKLSLPVISLISAMICKTNS